MKRVTLIIVATIAFLLLPGCGGAGGSGSSGGGGGGGNFPEDGIWEGLMSCETHPDQLYPNAYHVFWVRFEVRDRKIIPATSQIRYEHPDGYVASNTGAISGWFKPGVALVLERIAIEPLPGHAKHTLTKLWGNSQGPLNTDGANPPNTMSGSLPINEYGDDAPLEYVATNYLLEVARR